MRRQKVRELMVPTFTPKLHNKSPVLEADVFMRLTRAKERAAGESVTERRQNDK